MMFLHSSKGFSGKKRFYPTLKGCKCQVPRRKRYEYIYSTKCDLDEFKHTQIFNVVEI